ncbi:MAG TPA: hypothetical protein ENK52_03225 [Saprospiraceae bacterium]|nr:hypothetical protein [Saprospiraceae bacterium]
MKKISKSFVVLLFTGFFFFAFQPKANAWRLFGEEISYGSNHTAADGGCVRIKTTKRFFLGIRIFKESKWVDC